MGKKLVDKICHLNRFLVLKEVQSLDLVWTHLEVPLAYPRISSIEQTKTLQPRERMLILLFEMEKFAKILAQTTCIGLGLDESAK